MRHARGKYELHTEFLSENPKETGYLRDLGVDGGTRFQKGLEDVEVRGGICTCNFYINSIKKDKYEFLKK
jgi:hypothetical protein